jgi:hypothetical protein
MAHHGQLRVHFGCEGNIFAQKEEAFCASSVFSDSYDD